MEKTIDEARYECDGDTMTISGNFMKSSDIQPTKCPTNRISKINVFVMNTFYVDSDLNLHGYQRLNIFVWMELHKTRPHSSGTAGKPGDPGTSAGNFFGL